MPLKAPLPKRWKFNINRILSTILRQVSRLERIRVLKQNVEAAWPSGQGAGLVIGKPRVQVPPCAELFEARLA